MGSLLVFLLSISQAYTFQNSYEFFTPISKSKREILNISFGEPSKQKKVFEKEFKANDTQAILEIYFHNENEKYFSQQISLYVNAKLISICTSYFAIEQSYLVPGTCAGVSNNQMVGLTIYR